MHQSSTGRVVGIAGLVLVVGLGASAGAAEFTETRSFSSKSLTVTNLIGAIQVGSAEGSEFKVTMHIRGADAAQDQIGIHAKDDSLVLEFPDSKRFVYPNLGANDVRFSSNNGDQGWLSSLFGSSDVKISRSGNGTEIWADLEILVPSGARFTMKQGAGAIQVEGVDASMVLDSHYGQVRVEGVNGDLLVDTGSGDVWVANSRGKVSVDTGSGDVELRSLQCTDVGVDTGSGDVTLHDVTSSGDVGIDTGSGDVTGSGIRAESASIDTGSGEVSIMLTEMGHGRFVIDTGSGAVTLGVPSDADCDVIAEAGSGKIVVDIAGIKNMHREDDDEVEFSLGSGAASVRLDTGSGGIRIVTSK